MHDFDPGIHPYPDGLFWTVRVPDESVAVNLGAGTASIEVDNLPVIDFFSIPNALSNGAAAGSASATVSYAIHWHGVQRRRQVHNETLHVSGLFLDTAASIEWSGRNSNGFSFATASHGQTVISAQIGHERNGVFFGR